ncbi:MAG: DUF2147 domain-containing protein [Lentimicrobium sp.]|jgi:uncharacterized protein (DUF2147 family)|nr:DUF2147 domain-containing protein [Lentimicrobium sp.]MDD2528800.1 DUF2147 domain-containing protein [Lentimicrobiaceae bacterium]MDD4598374.1 DUF2147 domain-containing protein [Lentimicrobiaceae bacterium]MDY0025597.1 DUF2147 domain-containing protein [Lentimicrobium sp.]
MKNTILIGLLFIASLLPSTLKAQAKADKVLGYWLTLSEETGKPNSQVKISKGTNGKYYGEIVWLQNPLETNGREKLDKHNPDDKLKSRKLIGLRILNDFTYDASEDEWSGGSIYNPTTGKTYNSYMKVDGNKLNLRGYIGKAWMGLGKTAVWTREASQRK